jgi:hypothetical protein
MSCYNVTNRVVFVKRILQLLVGFTKGFETGLERRNSILREDHDDCTDMFGEY